jgi:hypothetical protein
MAKLAEEELGNIDREWLRVIALAKKEDSIGVGQTHAC